MLASRTVIRDVVIHLIGEQPLMADLPGAPQPGDVALVCTNLRMMNQRRPFFVEDGASTFVFPYSQVRFVEIRREDPTPPGEARLLDASPADPGDLPLDEELLRRVREL